MNIELWLAFTTVAFIATAIPGPAMLLVASHSISVGTGRTLITILGNITGLAILSSISVLGLGSIIIHSLYAFMAVKILGALYLIYLGITLWRKEFSPPPITADKRPVKSLSLYTQGIFLALSNPKAILFTTALYPHFIVPEKPLFIQCLILTITFVSLSFICLTLCSLAVSRSFTRIKHAGPHSVINKLLGSCFMGAGGLLLTTSR